MQISAGDLGDPKGSRFKCAAPRQSVLDPPPEKTNVCVANLEMNAETCWMF